MRLPKALELHQDLLQQGRVHDAILRLTLPWMRTSNASSCGNAPAKSSKRHIGIVMTDPDVVSAMSFGCTAKDEVPSPAPVVTSTLPVR